jgi:hypothetical protein
MVLLAGLLTGALMAISGGVAQAALPTVSVSVTTTSITVTGVTGSGAVNVVTTAAKGMKEPAPAFLLLKPGVSVAEAEAFLATNKTADPNTVSKIGSIAFDAEALAGGTSEAQTFLSPGTYLAVNAEGQKSSKWPRVAFTVTASPTPAALPNAEAVERTIDFGFKGPKTLHKGELVRFENEGYVVHMDLAFPTKNKKAAEQLAHALLAGHEKAAEKLIAGPPVGFAGPLSTGGLQQETITAAPGWYVQVCFMETQDGRDHTRLGMERVIKITK